MQISKDEWDLYLDALKLARDRASSELADYMETLDFESNPEAAYGAVTVKACELVQKYGNASATLASIMYDEISAAQHVVVPPAVPAMPAAPETVASIVSDVLSASATEEAFKHNIVQAIASETKRSAEDTMLKNANRDGAKFAWVCIGDTCAFCRAIGSRGFRYASDNVLKGNHADHIHTNCDCSFVISHTGEDLKIEGYNPDALYREYRDSPGKNSKDKINAMRRADYHENKDYINAQKRAAYRRRKAKKAAAAEEG